MERLLQQFLHSPAHRGFQFVIGDKALKDSLKGYEKTPKYRRLVISFEKGEDPDEAYSSIPYEKGANLILHIGMSDFTIASGGALLMPFRRADCRWP